jgi:homoserine kinase type II
MAVYTRIDETTLISFLDRYDLGELRSFHEIAEGIENTNYKIVTASGRYVLTIFEKRVNANDLPFYTGYMNHCRKHGIPCPEIMAARDGQQILPIAGKLALVCAFLDGGWPRDIQPHHCGTIGMLLADMHNSGRDFTMERQNTMGLSAWENLIHACRDRADTVEKGLFDFLNDEINHLRRHWPESLPSGAVHADLFPDNVFFNGHELSGVIDFYFSCTEIFTYDLMLTLNPWCFNNGVPDLEKTRPLLQSYHTYRPLSDAELSMLPFFGRAAALRIIATRLYDWLHPAEGALVKPKDPMEHVRILRFHQQAQSPADYGFER